MWLVILSFQQTGGIILQLRAQLMAERKAWTLEEDEALKEIVARGIKKWNQVAKLMEDDHAVFGRSGKQCRQRWHNQLDPKINSNAWTKDEEDFLFRLHNELGNSWAKISNRLKGRTDNCVKNHFYSTLRKSFRKLNRYIQDSKPEGLKELKAVALTKVLAAAEDKFDKKLKLRNEVIDKSIELKNNLIDFAYNEKEDRTKMNNMIRELHDFTKSWKRKKKKGKRHDNSFEEDDEDEEIEEEEDEESIDSPKKTIPPSPPPPPVPPLLRSSSRVMKEQPIIPPKPAKMQKKSSVRVAEEEPIQRRLSKRQSKQSRQSMSDAFFENILKKPSSLQEDGYPYMLRRQSSNRSNMSFFGGSLMHKVSDFELPRAGINFTDATNNLTSKNLFESDYLIERLDN